ncbi:hypothetical protein JCM8547_008471 [Rhodosporidiobolus lusitaniae]
MSLTPPSTGPPSSAPGVPPLDLNSKLTMEEIGSANRRAQIDGVAAGTCAGFLGGFISTKLLRQSRNLGLLSGVLTGSIVGYLITQESLKLQLAKARSTSASLRAYLAEMGKDEGVDMQGRLPKETWDMSKGEGGYGGQEGLSDKYATTKGDH